MPYRQEDVMDLKGRDFLTLKDYTPEEILYLIDLAAELKDKKKKGIVEQPLIGKNVALIFEKTSTRTRCSFEVAAHDLGMGVTYLDPTGSQIGKKESIADTARVLCTMFEGIEYRGFGQEIVEDLAKYSSVPVWNGLTNEYHPTQMLADMLTIKEKLGRLKGVKFVYMGDARYNMGNSLMIVCAKLGLHYTACTAKEYFPDKELVAQCEEWAKISGGSVTLILRQELRTQMYYTQMYGYQWASLMKYGLKESRHFFHIRLTRQLWTMLLRTQYLCTVFLHSMTLRLRLVKRFMTNSVLTRWKLLMKYLSQSSQLYSMRLRTECIQ